MKSQRNIARLLFGLTLTLVSLMSWNTLPIHLPERAVQAATRARVTEPAGQPVPRAAANGRIAFVSSEGNARADIYTMEADGSNVQRLTNNPAYDQGPKWSPDGTKIAFVSSRDDTSVRCESDRGCWLEIYVMNADGTNQTRTNNQGFDDSFDWSPDSTRIVFASSQDGSVGSISVMNADGSNVRGLTNYPGFNHSPKWSPDGTKIAFVRTDDYFDGTYNISVMNADGTNRTRYSDPQGYDPRWSPDGTKIVFVGMFESSNEICVMKTDGSNVQRLTNNPASDSTPKWSLDGSKITFIRACQHNRCPTQQPPHLLVVDADGSNPTQPTDVLAYDSAWSPDGTKIIFVSPDSGEADLFVMNPDGSGLTNITNTSGKYETSPSWQPISSSACTNPIDCAAVAANAASYSTVALAPDSIASIFGSNLATSEMAAETTTLPTSLAGTTVKVIDSANVERLAPLFYVSPRQINLLIPPGTALGKARLLVTAGDGALALGETMILSVSPGLFAANADGAGAAAAYVVRVKADGTHIYEEILQLDAGLGRYVAIPIDLGQEGETVFLVMHGTGVRGAAPGTVGAQIGGAEAAVSYAGPQHDYVGLDQLNLTIPRSLAGRGEVEVTILADNQAANPLRIKVQ